MTESFDAFEYLDYVRYRWRVPAIACGTALIVALGVSLLLPKQYTATASLLIEPPGGADARNTTTVSPMYLESLKTYETFAAGDSLFARAARRFHLVKDSGGPSIESLKRRVLRVSKLRDTKILEIRVSLPDPETAQGLAQYLAEETVSLNRGQSLAADREFIDDAEKQSISAQARLEKAQKAWSTLSEVTPVEALRAEIDADVKLHSSLGEDLVSAEADVAEHEQQQQSGGEFAREQLRAAQARAGVLRKRMQELDRSMQEKSALLAGRVAKRETLQTEMKMAQSSYETISARLRDLHAGAGTHTERLRVIDPGIVPQRPSSPNVLLNVAAAIFLALAASILYVSLAFAYRRRPVGFEAEMSRRMRA